MLERFKSLGRQTDILFTLGVVGIIVMMVMPIHHVVMDVLLALSITASLIVLLLTIYVKEPLQFSVFPSVLLILTLFRLALNIASTRLILINGHTGTAAAGRVIESFGQFVVSGNYVVGIIVFLILVIINFIVITKGAGRIAEVAARFVLDSMPGKQMSIDADLNAGIIKEAEARARRRGIEEEADFYGAMDGASKFVRGDAIAGLLITAINIIAGFIIGIAQHGLPLSKAAATYTILTVGDGLVSQIPALITSTAAGLLVTRSAGNDTMGRQLGKQLMSQWKVLAMTGFFLLGFSVVPGMPMVTFVLIGSMLLFLSRHAKRVEEEAVRQAAEITHVKNEAPAQTESEKLEAMLPVDLLDLEVGYGLIGLVDARQGGALLERITGIRRQFVQSFGFIVPPIHIRDNLQLKPNQYLVLLKGTEIARGEAVADRFLAMNPGDVTEPLQGIETVEPAFGLPAKWITSDLREEAEAKGYTVVDASTVIATHLSELFKHHAGDLVGRQELQHLLDIFGRSNPKLVEDLIPGQIGLGEVLKVVRNLLREQVSIRDLRSILETLSELSGRTKNTEILSELVRQRLAKSITSRYKSADGQVYAIMLDRALEDLFRANQRITDDEIQVAINPDQAKALIRALETQMEESSLANSQPVLLVSPEIRKAIYNFLQRFLPDLPVLSHREIDGAAKIQLVGTVAV